MIKNDESKWHVVKHGLDCICKTRTGLDSTQKSVKGRKTRTGLNSKICKTRTQKSVKHGLENQSWNMIMITNLVTNFRT